MAKAAVSNLVVGDFDYELSAKRVPVAGPVGAPATGATWGIASESGSAMRVGSNEASCVSASGVTPPRWRFARNSGKWNLTNPR